MAGREVRGRGGKAEENEVGFPRDQRATRGLPQAQVPGWSEVVVQLGQSLPHWQTYCFSAVPEVVAQPVRAKREKVKREKVKRRRDFMVAR